MDKADFCRTALDIFRFQSRQCKVYRSYLELLGVEPASVKEIRDIPFLPVEFFKTHTVYSSSLPPQHVFTSSATSGMQPAQHHVAKLGLYEKSFSRCFRQFFGTPEQYTILALLPAYLERSGSSLVYMVDRLMQQSGAPDNGFYLYNHQELYHRLCKLRTDQKPVILFGVSFALLDFLQTCSLSFPELQVIETGGMKGRGIELSRNELHQRLRQGFGSRHIHSEYGMAELLSQAYAIEGERFVAPPWMRVLIRDLHDPFYPLPCGQKGGVNLIDLANRYSCSFIETQDLGILHPDQSFEILGRIPFSELRGCNLLIDNVCV